MRWLYRAYLSGPIGSTNGEGHTWRQDTSAAILQEFGVASFSPTAFVAKDSNGTGDPVSRWIYDVNYAAIVGADAVLCVLPPTKSSIGSVREIQIARSRGLPVVVVYDGHWPHFGVDLEIVPTMNAAYEVIRGWCQTPRDEVMARYNR